MMRDYSAQPMYYSRWADASMNHILTRGVNAGVSAERPNARQRQRERCRFSGASSATIAPTAASLRSTSPAPLSPACSNSPSRWRSASSSTDLLPGENWGLIIVAADRAAGRLPRQHRPDGRRQLLGPHARDQHRDRDAPQELSTTSRSSRSASTTTRRPATSSRRVTKDLEEIGEVAHHGPEDLFIAIMTFIGAFVLMFCVNPPLALITADRRPDHRLDHRPLRRADDRAPGDALRARRRVQRADRGERRRHARRPGVRQRGPRAPPVRAEQRALPRQPSSRPTGS